MIVVMKPNAKEEHINNIIERLKEAGLGINKKFKYINLFWLEK